VSLRALGRQWKSQIENRNKSWVPGIKDHPRYAQGILFGHQEGGKMPLHTPQWQEAIRRKEAGENNPGHSWDPPMLQHHFQERWDRKTGRLVKPPVQQDLF
jgi:hypothetical protein